MRAAVGGEVGLQIVSNSGEGDCFFLATSQLTGYDDYALRQLATKFGRQFVNTEAPQWIKLGCAIRAPPTAPLARLAPLFP